MTFPDSLAPQLLKIKTPNPRGPSFTFTVSLTSTGLPLTSTDSPQEHPRNSYWSPMNSLSMSILSDHY